MSGALKASLTRIWTMMILALVVLNAAALGVACAEGVAVIFEEDEIIGTEAQGIVSSGIERQAGQSGDTNGAVRIVITAGGDVTLGSTDNQRKSDAGFDSVIERNGYEWPFSGVIDCLRSDDLTLVNFEGTLTDSNVKQEKLFNFKGPAEYADMLTLGSIEAVNLANNHTLDYGKDGFADTIAALEAADITYCASGKTAVFTAQGVKIGLIGNTFPYANGKRDVRAAVKSLRDQGCAVVIASFHWGSEYETKFSAEQRSIGRAAIDAGADVVIGHHPHIVQGVELYKGKYILYSLGNFVFGGNVNPEDRDSYLARLTFNVNDGEAGPMEFEMIPIRLTELDKGTDYRPVLAMGSEAERIRDRVLARSYKVEDIALAKTQ
ncbi:MAG: CapA family protein [Oscillospiraceae bacterium]|jgi:poly-gamma-glutamate synthesis protein (capsule biosynthesis protein)|nr:CapA family protein [Oscillospiraceae bacterium]